MPQQWRPTTKSPPPRVAPLYVPFIQGSKGQIDSSLDLSPSPIIKSPPPRVRTCAPAALTRVPAHDDAASSAAGLPSLSDTPGLTRSFSSSSSSVSTCATHHPPISSTRSSSSPTPSPRPTSPVPPVMAKDVAMSCSSSSTSSSSPSHANS